MTLHVGRRSFAQINAADQLAHYDARPDVDLRVHWFPRAGLAGRLLFSTLSYFSQLISPPDLYYGRHTYGFLPVAIMGRAFALEVHSTPVDAREFKLINRLISSRGFKGLVTISEALRAEYSRLYPALAPERIIVAHDGADATDATTIPPSPKRVLRCGYAGHLYKGKGVELILQIAAKIPDAEFHIVGGNEDDIKYWKSTSSLGNVVFHGHRPARQVPQFLSEMDVLLAPYQREVMVHGGGANVSHWMSPLKIFEYMAANRPIICSDLSVLHEILDHERTCLFAPPDDALAWASMLDRLHQQPAFAAQLARNARKELISRFTWSSRANSILRALSNNPSTSGDSAS